MRPLFQAGSRGGRSSFAHRARPTPPRELPGRVLPCRHRKRRHDRVSTSAGRPTASPSFSTTTARGGGEGEPGRRATPAARLARRLKNGERLPFLARCSRSSGKVRSTSNRKRRRDRAAARRGIRRATEGNSSCRRAARRVPCARDLLPRSRAGWSRPPIGIGSRLLPPPRVSPRSTPTAVSSRCCGSGRSRRRHPAPAVHGRRPGEGRSRSCRRRRRRLLQPAPSPSAGSGAGASLRPIVVRRGLYSLAVLTAVAASPEPAVMRRTCRGT